MGVINGTTLDDTLPGTSGDDIIYADAGNDIVESGSGNDTVYGEAGNDTITLQGTAGTAYGGTEDDTITGADGGSFSLYGDEGNDDITAGGGTNIVNGGTGNDSLFSHGVNDSLYGDADNDWLSNTIEYVYEASGVYVTNLYGGTGNDTYTIYDYTTLSETVTVTENASEGTDTVESGLVSYTLTNNVENLVLLSGITSGYLTKTETALNGTGNSLNNTITGNEANNTINGGTGNDTLVGGTGDDTYYVDSVGDVVTELAGEGTDTVYTSVNNVVLADNVENMFLTSAYTSITIHRNATGNSLNNTITDNDNRNGYLYGMGGNDTLYGSGGRDYLYGGDNDDVLDGGTDTDALYGEAGNDTLIGGTGITYDTLDGGTGADSMSGGAGDDFYYIDDAGDIVTENIDEGYNDAVNTRMQHYTLNYANVEIINIEYGADGSSATGDANLNRIEGDDFNNTITGLDGDDSLLGAEGNDSLYGGGDDDYIIDYQVSDWWEGGPPPAGNDHDYIEGGDGNDYIGSIKGDDTLLGGLGNDIINATADYFAHDGNVSVEGGDGNDTIVTGTISADILGGAGADEIYGFSATETIDAGDDNDIVVVDASTATVEGGLGDDTLIAGGFWVDAGANFYANATEIPYPDLDPSIVVGTNLYFAREDLSFASATSGTYTLNGGEGNDSIIGGYEYNTINGGEGNDTLISFGMTDTVTGGAGDDQLWRMNYYNIDMAVGATLQGGTGNDSYFIDHLVDFLDPQSGITYTYDDTITIEEVADEGIDTVYSGLTTYTLTDNVENLTLINNGDPTYAQNGITGIGNALGNTITGSDLDNIISGLGGADSLIGGAGNDDLNGGEGNDTYYFAAGFGQDTITDASGLDSIVFDAAITSADVLFEVVGSDLYIGLVDGVHSTASTVNDRILVLGGASTIETIPYYALIGTESADTIYGSGSLNDRIYGLGGNDTLYGYAGDDTLTGGEGADTLEGGAGTDYADYSTSTSGINVRLANTVYNTGDAVGDVYVSIEGLIGSDYDDVLYGTNSANVIYGGNGHDKLQGISGADTLYGGSGNDTYYVDNIGDLTLEDTIPGVDDGGTDTVSTSVALTLDDYIENLTITNTAGLSVTGNSLNNTITGDIGNDTLAGSSGDDTLIGGLGADSMVGGSGIDLASYKNATAAVRASLGSPASNTGEAAGDTYTGIEGLYGSYYDDILVGSSANNILWGWGGSDNLNGSSGADTLYGGAGSDIYTVENVGDVVSEESVIGIDDGGSADRVNSSISYSLGSFVENLTLTGTSDINATGNSLVNTLTGNTGNNILDGGSGADKLNGGAGNDTYVVDNAGDIITESAGAGTDLVQSSVTHTLKNNVENLTLTGSASIGGTGNTLDNIITGNSAGNALNGSTGTDTVYGLGGDDTYTVDNVSDLCIEDIVDGVDDGGYDRINSSVSYTLGDYIERITLTGSANIDAIGNGLDNAIFGNTGNNSLTGGAGSDTLTGNAGDDTYIFGPGFGNDTIKDSAGTDTIMFAAGIDAADIITEVVGADLYYAISDGINTASNCADRICISGGAAATVIEAIVYTATPAPAIIASANSLAQAMIMMSSPTSSTELDETIATLAAKATLAANTNLHPSSWLKS